MKQIIFIVVVTLLATVTVGASRPTQTDDFPKFETVTVPGKLNVQLASASEPVDKASIKTKPQQAAPQAASGDKYTWLRASGIPESEWQYVDYIVSKESGWKPCAFNPSQNDCSANPSSACGLAQSLPCGKQSVYGHWTDPVANLKWQYDYVKGRYGGYAQAYAFWVANKWY